MIYKGAFWITENDSEEYFFRIPCDVNGNVSGETEYPLCSKDGTNYNHRALWSFLPKILTHGKTFDYYPRGRVEIRNAKATVYLNPDINYSEMQDRVIGVFGLRKENGIASVRFVSDGSNHYQYSNNEISAPNYHIKRIF